MNWFACCFIFTCLFFEMGCTESIVNRKINKRRAIVIHILPIENIDTAMVKFVKKELERFYGAEVHLLPRHAMFNNVYSAGCARISADSILDRLNAEFKNKQGKILALTNYDIATFKNETNCWGIFGLGQLPGKACVASTCRLGFGNASNSQIKERFAKVVLHEIGHTFGIPHCQKSDTCMMQSAKGKGSTLDKEKSGFVKVAEQRF